EIADGLKRKYELDKESARRFLDGVLGPFVVHPANYVLVPQTYCDDNDPLDHWVLCSVDILPVTLVEAKIIGVMNMLDGGEQDDKIIAVAKHDPAYSHLNDIEDLAPHTMKEIVQFFESYKALEKQEVSVDGVFGRERAQEILVDSIELYKKEFG